MNVLRSRSAAQDRGHKVYINRTISPSDGSSEASATLKGSNTVTSQTNESTLCSAVATNSPHRLTERFEHVCDYRLYLLMRRLGASSAAGWIIAGD